MASIKKTFYLTFSLILVIAMIAGGTYVWFLWQDYQVRQRLEQADALAGDQQWAAANQLLTEMLSQAQPDTPWAARALNVRLQALEAMGDGPALQALAETVLNADRPWVHPGQEAWARAQLALGDAALGRNAVAEARAAFEAILAQPPGTNGQDEARFGLARIELATEGELAAGKARMETLLETLPPDAPLRAKVQSVLGKVNVRMLMHPQPYGEDQLYVIARGDTIDGMARRFKISPDLLMRVNGISDPRRLTVGRRIKIPDLDLSIAVNKSDNTLTLLNHGKFFKQYAVRTGEFDYMTPVGQYAIGTKVKDPSWTNPKTRERFGPGTPGNELGARWMGFEANPTIGIHEAVDPTTVGTYGSNGCVGLAHEDILELYDLVRNGTPVAITGQTAKAAQPVMAPEKTTGKTPNP